MVPAASEKDHHNQRAKVVRLKVSELTISKPAEGKQKTKEQKREHSEEPENPFAHWTMPPQPSGVESAPEWEFL